MTTKFLKDLERRYAEKCNCESTRTVTNTDSNGDTYEQSVCTNCHKKAGNIIWHEATHHIQPENNIFPDSNEDQDDIQSLEDDLYSDNPEVYRTPRKYRARYRTITSKQYITLRGNDIEFSGKFSRQHVKLIRSNQADLLENVTVSLEEFLDHLAPSGAIYT